MLIHKLTKMAGKNVTFEDSIKRQRQLLIKIKTELENRLAEINLRIQHYDQLITG